MASDSSCTRGDSDISHTTALISELEEELQCAICQDRLRQPRMLSCLHSFCESCLRRCYRASIRDMLDSDDDDEEEDDLEYPIIKCPCCREETELPDEGISGLKPDFRANKFGDVLDALNKRKRKFAESEYACDVCDLSVGNSPASDYCQECGQLFCELCSKVHRKLTGSKEHHVVGVSDLMMGTAKLRKTEHEDATYKTCPMHSGERLKSFCKTCMKPVCFVCASFGVCLFHKSSICSLDEAIGEMSGVVGMLADRLKHQQRRIDEMLAAANDVVEKTRKAKNVSLDKINKIRDAFIRLINGEFQKAVHRREALYNGKVNCFQGMAQEMLKMKTVAEKTMQLTEEVLKGDEIHGIDLATMHACLQSVLSSVPQAKLDSVNHNVSQMNKDISLVPEEFILELWHRLRQYGDRILENIQDGRSGRPIPATPHVPFSTEANPQQNSMTNASSVPHLDPFGRPNIPLSGVASTSSLPTNNGGNVPNNSQSTLDLPECFRPLRRLSCPSTSSNPTRPMRLSRPVDFQSHVQVPSSIIGQGMSMNYSNPSPLSGQTNVAASASTYSSSPTSSQRHVGPIGLWARLPRRPPPGGLLYSPLTLPNVSSGIGSLPNNPTVGEVESSGWNHPGAITAE